MKSLICILACLICISIHAELFFTPEMISLHLREYSDEDLSLLEKDLKVVRSVCFEGTCKCKKRFYLATGGGPGARKTTILEKFVSTHPEYRRGVYLDPDTRTLKFMVHTYYARSLTPLVIATTGSYDQVIKNAYEKWRAGSNYIVLTLLEEAFAGGRGIIYGTTSTGAHVPDFFTKLKENDYQIVLLLCSCPDNMRYQAVDYRNNVVRFYQSSPEDAVAKGTLFSERMGTYFAHADQIYFYWSDNLLAPERLAAIWSHGKLEILDSDAMQCFIDKYEADRAKLNAIGKSLPAFDTFL